MKDKRGDLVSDLKAKLQQTPMAIPDVETVEPEIRTVAQYALLPSMKSGFSLDKDDATKAENES
jgi:phage FluMu gp28-like protein